MTYTEKDLLRDAATCAKKAGNKEVTVETYQSVWAALLKWIHSQFTIRKGACLSGFCTLSWRRTEAVVLKKEVVLRPVFFPVDSFIKAHNIQWRGLGPTPGEVVKAEDINFSKIAIRFSETLNKDTVFTCTRHIIAQIGKVLSTSGEVCIDFGIGSLISKDRKLDFHFQAEWARGIKIASGGSASSQAATEAPSSVAPSGVGRRQKNAVPSSEPQTENQEPQNFTGDSNPNDNPSVRAGPTPAAPQKRDVVGSASKARGGAVGVAAPTPQFISMTGAPIQVPPGGRAASQARGDSGRLAKGGSRAAADRVSELMQRQEAMSREASRSQAEAEPCQPQEVEITPMPQPSPTKSQFEGGRVGGGGRNSQKVREHEEFLAHQAQRLKQEKQERLEREKIHDSEIANNIARLNAEAMKQKEASIRKKAEYSDFLKSQMAAKQRKAGGCSRPVETPLMPAERREKSSVDIQMRQGQYRMDLEEQIWEKEWNKYMQAEEDRLVVNRLQAVQVDDVVDSGSVHVSGSAKV